MVQSGPRREPQAFTPKSALVIACSASLSTLFALWGSLRDPQWWLWAGLACSAYVTGWWIINVGRVYGAPSVVGAAPLVRYRTTRAARTTGSLSSQPHRRMDKWSGKVRYSARPSGSRDEDVPRLGGFRGFQPRGRRGCAGREGPAAAGRTRRETRPATGARCRAPDCRRCSRRPGQPLGKRT